MNRLDALLYPRPTGRHRAGDDRPGAWCARSVTATRVTRPWPARGASRRLARAGGLGTSACFLIYLLLSTYASELTDIQVAGGLNLGITLGLLQLAGFLASAACGPEPGR